MLYVSDILYLLQYIYIYIYIYKQIHTHTHTQRVIKNMYSIEY